MMCVLQHAEYQSNNNNHIYLQRNHYTMIHNKKVSVYTISKN
jgi:hypothetical protein